MFAKKRDITTKQFKDAVITFTLMEMAGATTCIIDGVVTGRFLGGVALAGVGLADIYFTLCAMISFSLAASVQSLGTKYLGIGDTEKSDQAVSTIAALALILSVIITIAGIALAGPLAYALGARGANSELYQYTKPYFLGMFAGAVPNIMRSVLSPILTLDGKGTRVNVASAAVFVTDVALDLANVYFIHWGTFGMGLATSFSHLAALIVILTGLADTNSAFHLSVSNIRFDMTKEIIQTGISRGIGMVSRAFGPIIINLYVLSVASTAGLTALSVQLNVKYICMAPAWGISSAVLLMAGFFYGECDTDGIKKIVKMSIKYTLAFYIPFSILLILLGPKIAAVYIGQENDAYWMSVELIQIFYLSLTFVGLNFIASCLLQAVGRNKGAFLFNSANEFIGLVLFVVVMGNIFGIDGVWWALFVWQIVLLAIYVIIALIRKTKNQDWKTKLLYLDDDFCSRNAHVYCAMPASFDDAAAQSERIRLFCIENGIAENKAMKLALCMEELADNVIEHGFEEGKENYLEIRVVIDRENVILHLRDNCRRFDFKTYAEGVRFDPEHPEHCIGTRLVFKMVREISYSNTLNANNLVVKI